MERSGSLDGGEVNTQGETWQRRDSGDGSEGELTTLLETQSTDGLCRESHGCPRIKVVLGEEMRRTLTDSLWFLDRR